MTEKRKPSFNLESFKNEKRDITTKALCSAANMGYGTSEINAAIAGMRREHFYKSMTSYANNKVWQDVYHVPYDGKLIYIKFTQGIVCEFLLLSFKEK